MRTALLALSFALFAFPIDAQPRSEQALGWRIGPAASSFGNVTFFEAIDKTGALGRKALEVEHGRRVGGEISRPLDERLKPAQRAAVRDKLKAAGIELAVYSAGKLPASAKKARRVFELARDLGAGAIAAAVEPASLDELEKLAEEYGLSLAIEASAGALPDISKRGKRVGFSVSSAAALEASKGRSLVVRVSDANQAEVLKTLYVVEAKPALVAIVSANAAQSFDSLKKVTESIASYHQSYVARTQGVRRAGGVSAEERQKIEAALPASAPAKPRKPRRLLVVDLNVGRGGHPSIPHANLAAELMGKKTGAWETVLSQDASLLNPESLKSFDAVFLNNTIGPIFGTPERREAFRAFIANGGGLIANHAATVTETDWPEFGEILGARGASHRLADEKAVVKVERPGHPITAMFGASFEFADEFFRFEGPYSRDKVQVLLSIDTGRTDMAQGRCFGKCDRPDKDYPVSWIRNYGKGRVFYCSIAHNPYVFWDPKMLAHYQAAIQWALGDLDAPAAP